MTYRSIEYDFFSCTNSAIRTSCSNFLLLPAAGGITSKHLALINSFKDIGNLLVIKSGYYGITDLRKVPLDSVSQFSITDFKKNLTDLMATLNLSDIVIIAASVGCIHALEYFLSNKESTKFLILGSPAIHKQTHFNYMSSLFLINLVLSLHPDFLLDCGLKLLKKLKKLRDFAEDVLIIISRVGARSYLLCLQDIVKFASKYKSVLFSSATLKSKCIVVVGKDDPFFDKLCDFEICKSSLDLDTGHDVFLGYHGFVLTIIGSHLNS